MAESGNAILSTCWALGSIATISMGARLYARLVYQGKLGWDDHFIIISWLLAIASAILVSYAVHYGLGSDINTIKDPMDQMNAIKYLTIAPPPSIMSVALGKVSVIFLLHRLMGTTMTKPHFWVLWTITFISVGLSVAAVVVVLGFCYPIEAIWNKEVKGSCIDPNIQLIVGLTQSGFNSFTDIFLAVYPAWIFWGLNMTLRRKIGLMMLLGVGIFGAIISSYKAYQLRNITGHDNLTLSWAPITIWFIVEMFILIVTANIPTLRPLFRAVLGIGSSAKRTYYQDGYPLSSGAAAASSKKKSNAIPDDGCGTNRSNGGGSGSGSNNGFERISDKQMGYVTYVDSADDDNSVDRILKTPKGDEESGTSSLNNSKIVKSADFTVSYEHPPRPK